MHRGAPATAQLPEPGRLWIRWVPRAWPAPDCLSTDLARAAVGTPADTDPEAASASEDALSEAARRLEALAAEPLDDLLYLPPAPPALAGLRAEVAAAHLARGTPVLVQLRPGEEPLAGALEEATVVWDLLGPLLEKDLEALAALPMGAAAVWPLVPGLTDDPALWQEGCRRLAEAGIRVAQPLALELSPAERRSLSAFGDERSYQALFHRGAVSERPFARVAAEHGLEPFLPRPLPRPPLQGEANRRLAGQLALVAELLSRLERPPTRGESFFRAARWVDGTRYDVEALAREGHLSLVEHIEPPALELLLELVREGEAALTAELLAEYLGSDS